VRKRDLLKVKWY